MVIGFGFGSPLVSILMLIATSLLSYGLFRLLNRTPRTKDLETRRKELRKYYQEQRELARRMASEFDVSDDEIEARIERDLRRM